MKTMNTKIFSIFLSLHFLVGCVAIKARQQKEKRDKDVIEIATDMAKLEMLSPIAMYIFEQNILGKDVRFFIHTSVIDAGSLLQQDEPAVKILQGSAENRFMGLLSEIQRLKIKHQSMRKPEIAKNYTSQRIELISRFEFEKVLKEQKLSLSGAISEETKLKLGRILGATHMLSNTVVFSSSDIEDGEKPLVQRSLIDLTTGALVATDETPTVLEFWK